ncbi:uncharacterized protein LOC100186110 [Ciona intestinalis]
MKLLLVLLACIAATNAGYSYSYYCAHKFNVVPCTRYFTYNVYFKNCWCSSAYYSNVLKVYPGVDCGKEGWTETPVSELTAELTNTLKDSLFKITKEMDDRKQTWLNYLDETIASYKESYKSYLTKYYGYRIECAKTDEEKASLAKERDDKIKEYDEKLDASRNEALKKYNEAIAAKVAAVSEYHQKLIENATKCLTSRVEKIKEYKKTLALKVKSYVQKFLDYHVAVLKQKEEYYRQVLAKIYGSETWEKAKVDDVLVSYHRQELREISKLGKEYAAKLATSMKQLITYYTCAYKCTLSNSCLRFYQRNYYSCSYKLGCWWRYTSSYRCVRACLNPFTYNWRKVTYKGLCKCDLTKVNKPVEDIVKDMTDKVNAIIAERQQIFNAMKLKWSNYHVDYIKAYTKIIEDRHAFYIKYVTKKYSMQTYCSTGSYELTDEQKAAIAQLTAELKEKLRVAVAEYTAKLAALIQECIVSFNKRLADYKKLAFEYIETIKTKYNACLTKRASNIADYQKKLEKSRDAQRAALDKSSYDAKVAHWDAYNKLLAQFHPGTMDNAVMAMRSCYASKLLNYCSDLLADFDAYWASTIPQLVQHYACHYKCGIRYCIPSYPCGTYFRWSYRLPSTQCYQLYYSCYRQYGCYYTK